VPTYQYACTECEHSFEQVQSFSDDSLTVCPRCEGRLRKIFNAAAVVFKGSGFYRTDSRAADKAAVAASASTSNGSTSNGESSTSGSGEAKSGTTKTDTPAAKPEKVAAATKGSAASKPKAGSTSAA
jgi:putative FmdB family regulatory protein